MVSFWIIVVVLLTLSLSEFLLSIGGRFIHGVRAVALILLDYNLMSGRRSVQRGSNRPQRNTRTQIN